MANRSKQPSEKDLREIETMAGLGLRYEDIAAIKGMCADTLKKYADATLTRGRAKANANVMQTAYQMAVSGQCPALTIFWLKTRCKWREHSAEDDLALARQIIVEGLDFDSI